MSESSIRPVSSEDAVWVRQFIRKRWGSDRVACHGTTYYPHHLPGFVDVDGDERVGLVTLHVSGDNCEIVTLDSLRPGSGIGTALIEAAKEFAIKSGCRRLWLVTTNDNLNALRFYQKRGFELVSVHRNAVASARRLKPEIPLIGADGIPVRDEIELELMLPAA